MAKRRRRKGLGLGFSPDRWVVFSPEGVFDKYGNQVKDACAKTTYTSYGDAAKAALRCSRSNRVTEPCLLLGGWSSGAQRLIGRCFKGRCSKPKEGDAGLLDKCKTRKKVRKSLIAQRVAIRQSRSSGPLAPSKATPSRAAKLDGRRSRRR
jgi:hypothetical protein